jgi:hypothetical protein
MFGGRVTHLEPWGTGDLPLLVKLKIVAETGGEGVGWVGFWETTWHDEQVWGDRVDRDPELPGRDVTSSATAELIDRTRRNSTRPDGLRAGWGRGSRSPGSS